MSPPIDQVEAAVEAADAHLVIAPTAEAESVRRAVRAVRNGDREAFRQLVLLYQKRLFGLAAMMTRHTAGAEEVTQDAFVNAYTHLDRYDERRPFYPWLATIAVRLAQTWLRQHTRLAIREGTDLDAIAEPQQPTAPSSPLSALIADETRRSLWQSVETLSLGERTVVLLYYRQDMAVGEIASELGVTTGTVKTLLFRARQRLRHTMQTTGEINGQEEESP